ncbi:MAG: hypothetical protein ACI86M_002089, partial [Saprospiraceae bacterium]
THSSLHANKQHVITFTFYKYKYLYKITPLNLFGI